MRDFTLHGQKISVSHSNNGYRGATAYNFKLYVDGDLRDESGYLSLRKDWSTFARAGVTDEQGQKRELRLEVRKKKQGLLALLSPVPPYAQPEWRFIYNDREVGSGRHDE
jgi:hypothetical protein